MAPLILHWGLVGRILYSSGNYIIISEYLGIGYSREIFTKISVNNYSFKVSNFNSKRLIC